MRSSHWLERFERGLARIVETSVVALLSVIAAICFVEVVLRYGFRTSFGWYDEFVGYLLVWLTFLGAVLAQHNHRHIGVDSLPRKLAPRLRHSVALLIQLLMFAVHLVLLFTGAQLASRFLAERAITLPVPMGALYLVIPLSAALMLALQGIEIARLWRTLKERPAIS